jgi:hypothetical protein
MKSIRSVFILCALAPAIFLVACAKYNRETDDTHQTRRKIFRQNSSRHLGSPARLRKKGRRCGLWPAYGHAEDDFRTIQLVLMAVNGRLSSELGRKGAGNDYLVHLIRLWTPSTRDMKKT